MIGLPAVRFLGVEDGADGKARAHVETKASAAGWPTCGVVARVKGPAVRRARRPPHVRSAGAPRAAQAPVATPARRLRDGAVNRRKRSYRCSSPSPDGAYRPVGDPPGRTTCEEREPGRPRARLRLTHRGRRRLGARLGAHGTDRPVAARALHDPARRRPPEPVARRRPWQGQRRTDGVAGRAMDRATGSGRVRHARPLWLLPKVFEVMTPKATLVADPFHSWQSRKVHIVAK